MEQVMAVDLRAPHIGAPNETECTLSPLRFQGMVHTLECMTNVIGPQIMIENAIVSTSFSDGIAWADLPWRGFNSIPMTFYTDQKNLRELRRLYGGQDVRIYYDTDRDTYFAHNGTLGSAIGKRAPGSGMFSAPTLENTLGTAMSQFKTSALRTHLGKAEKVFLYLYHGQLEQVGIASSDPFTLDSRSHPIISNQVPDLTLVVNRVLKVKADVMDIQVGKIGEDYYVETVSRVTENTAIHVLEKAHAI